MELLIIHEIFDLFKIKFKTIIISNKGLGIFRHQQFKYKYA